MKKIVPVIFILLLWAIGIGIWLIPNSQPYVVLVRALDEQGQVKWTGSACFIRKNLLLTAGHIVNNTQCFEIVLPNGKVRPGFFEYWEDPNLTDVGFIRVHGDYPVGRFGKSPHLGQDVWVMGYAWAEIPLTLTKGIVSCVNRDEDFFGKINLLQIDSASWPGHSGSPVLDKHNHVVGILIGGLQDSDNWSICVPVDVIRLVLAKHDAMEALYAIKTR